MMIREEQPQDRRLISELTRRAFATVAHSARTEADIIERLRTAGALTVSLVAIEGTGLIGHVAFSPVTIEAAQCGWVGLGPVSVEPSRQARGVGSALIRAGLDRLLAQGVAGCVVLGDPAYYHRFGFGPARGLVYEGAPPEYFMRLNLTAAAAPAGRVRYAPAFGE